MTKRTLVMLAVRFAVQLFFKLFNTQKMKTIDRKIWWLILFPLSLFIIIPSTVIAGIALSVLLLLLAAPFYDLAELSKDKTSITYRLGNFYGYNPDSIKGSIHYAWYSSPSWYFTANVNDEDGPMIGVSFWFLGQFWLSIYGFKFSFGRSWKGDKDFMFGERQTGISFFRDMVFFRFRECVNGTFKKGKHFALNLSDLFLGDLTSKMQYGKYKRVFIPTIEGMYSAWGFIKQYEGRRSRWYIRWRKKKWFICEISVGYMERLVYGEYEDEIGFKKRDERPHIYSKQLNNHRWFIYNENGEVRIGEVGNVDGDKVTLDGNKKIDQRTIKSVFVPGNIPTPEGDSHHSSGEDGVWNIGYNVYDNSQSEIDRVAGLFAASIMKDRGHALWMPDEYNGSPVYIISGQRDWTGRTEKYTQ